MSPNEHAAGTHPPPRWQRRKDERPSEILVAALDTFVERGFAATRLEDIARRAGCTKGTIFLYFANKEELFKAVVREAIVPFIEDAESAVDAHRGSARELLERLLRERWARLASSPVSCMPKLMVSEAANFPELARFYHDEVVDRGHRLLTRVLALGVERGEFRPVDVEHTARVIVAPLLLAAVWRHSFAPVTKERIDVDAYFDSFLDLLFRSLAPAAPGGAAHA